MDRGVKILSRDNSAQKQWKRGNNLVGYILRNFELQYEKDILILYSSLVCSKLEYCGQFWSSYYKKRYWSTEKIQRRVMKMIPRPRNMLYEEQLKISNLSSLTKSRIRGDLLEPYKFFKGYSNLDVNEYLAIDHWYITVDNGTQ